MSTWSLDALFKSYDDPAYQSALETIDHTLKEANIWLTKHLEASPLEALKDGLNLSRRVRKELIKVGAFVNLSLATNTTDEPSLKAMQTVQGYQASVTPFNTGFQRFVAGLENLDTLLEDPEVAPYEFYLTSIQDRAKYQLSDGEEALLSKLSQTGSSAWSRLQGELTSTMAVPFRGEVKNLSDIRNLAHAKDAHTRQEAYEAEMAAYPSVERSVASALNAIKGEVLTVTKARGYESPLAQAVIQSRMQQDTLDALIAAMQDALPSFRAYLKRKAALLGHENALPWYDLFAPIGTSSTTFTPASAMAYVIKQFKTFSDDLAALATRAYDEQWIDFYPKSGKRGGAFCSNLHPIKQSRILTNFEGSFSNLITLAHELGHAYHGDKIFNEDILNASYTMPVAETASTLCETIVKKAAIKDAANDDEKIFLLEQSIMGSTQVIVDILSRYSFENNVFEARKQGPLSAKRLNALMSEAQAGAYGDAIQADVRHPYMWINKPHYYSAGLSFYNFPYAFGLLFAKGIYAQYQEKGSTFVKDIDHLLQKTGQMTVEDVADLIGLNVREKAFWDTSLEVIKEEIAQFIALTDGMV